MSAPPRISAEQRQRSEVRLLCRKPRRLGSFGGQERPHSPAHDRQECLPHRGFQQSKGRGQKSDCSAESLEDWAGSGAKNGPTHLPMTDKNVCPTEDFSRAKAEVRSQK